MLSDEILYPCVGAALALFAYFAFFHETKRTSKEQDNADESLLDAAQAGNLEACQAAVEEDGAILPSGPQWANKPSKKSAVHAAAQYGHNEVVEWLVLEKDVPADLPDFAKMRPLHYAAMKGRTKTCKLLLRVKADPEAADTAGYSCVHFAASGGYEETLEVLVKAKGDVNGRDQGGFTPLMLAAIKGKSAAVQWLLDNGADKHTWNQQEATAYDLALRRQHKSVLAILEGKPARVVPQARRQEAEDILKRQADKSASTTAATPAASLRQRANAKPAPNEDDDENVGEGQTRQSARAAAKKKLERTAVDLAKEQASGKAQSKKLAGQMNQAGMGKFQGGGDFDPRAIKENFPDAWERAREEISGMEGGQDALESLLDTVE